MCFLELPRSVGFLTRYDEELMEPLVQCQVSQVSMRVARWSAKVPHWGGIGAFGVSLFGSVPDWLFSLPPSSQPEGSAQWKAARWEKGQRKPAPITAIPSLQGGFRGSSVIPLLLLGPPRLT